MPKSKLDPAAKLTAKREKQWEKICEKLKTARPFLNRQGSLAKRRTAKGYVWLLRYFEPLEDGKRVQRCIYVGDDILANRVRWMLDTIRDFAQLTNKSNSPNKAGDKVLKLARKITRRGRRGLLPRRRSLSKM
jgi:hypothetical protein